MSAQIVARADRENSAAREAKRKADEEKEAKARAELAAQPAPVAAAAEAGRETPLQEEPLLDLSFAAAEAQPAAAAAAAAAPVPVVAATIAAQPPPAAMTAAAPDRDTLVTNMMGATKQDRDVCYFYLECADWNLESAIELLKSMQAISN